MSSPTRIAKAKVVRPRKAANTLCRQTITSRESELDSARLVIVEAPAGFGKTTAMMQLAEADQRMGNAVVWITLDPDDNDVSRFLRVFSLALSQAQIHTAPPTEEGSRNADLADWIIGAIESSEHCTSVYFDNFEALRNPVVIDLIMSGTHSLPPGSRAVIGTRRQADLNLARLRARGELIEFGANDLRFSLTETQDYLLGQRKLTLNEIQIQRLHDSTDGWAAALWLASVALQNNADPDATISQFSGSNAAVASYLAEDVLAKLPERLRQFLLDISILNEIYPELCEAVTQCEDGPALLQELYRHNLFVQVVDEHSQQYSFHALFQDFLAKQLEDQDPDHRRRLHARAADAYVSQGRAVPAIGHRIKAGQSAAAIDLLLENLRTLLNDGRLRLLLRFIDELPQEEVLQRQSLQLIRVWCVAFTRSPREALTLIDSLDPDKGSAEEQANLLVLRPMLLGMVDEIDTAHELGLKAFEQLKEGHYFANAMLAQALTQTSIITGDHDAARRFVDNARGRFSQGAGTFGAVLAESAEGLMDLMKGHLQLATGRLRHAMAAFAASRKQDRRGITLAAIYLAEALYEAGELDEAAKLLVTYTPLVRDIGPADALISAHTVHARIMWGADQNTALDLLRELEDRGHALQLPRVVASARLQRAKFRLDSGDIDAAEEDIRSAENSYQWPDMNHRWYVGNDTLTPEISRLRLALRSGRGSQVIPQLRDALKEAERTQHVRRALKLRLLLAEALQDDKQRNLARRTLGRALQVVDQEGFVSTLREEGPKLQGLIRELQPEHAQAATQSTPAPAQPPGKAGFAIAGEIPTANMPNDPLTPKELQVLSLLAEGLSNIAISERLFVSESTVRTHLRSINLKLEAGNRTEAVVIARRLGLII
ncbi:LuxR C-terminal-related transcriptional regulator [Spongiibacter taiwanensis]|uniref:LuxR C-terminal-related transcriptional regulator n=1 Tax=Spongiibacter taiwanensis TaxID=1748242 RepID=UPI002034BC50|nr:LuxR C-terminal-related transcriptional regulator [Spongiibacter taiwanensis]USA42633.1 LuxR C-terminal-related transcriptional regulator [Spongiibacter taiwanensis]